MSRGHVIIAHAIDTTQRNLIQARVRTLADEWWHELPDVWIVKSDETAAWWRDQIGVFTPHSPSSLLVLGLSGAWATKMLRDTAWMKEHLKFD